MGKHLRFNPWIGERISLAWQNLVEIISKEGFADYNVLIESMAKEGSVTKKTAQNIIYRASKEGALRAERRYSEKTGKIVEHTIFLGHNWNESWSEPPSIQELKERRRRIVDRQNRRSDPIEARYDV